MIMKQNQWFPFFQILHAKTWRAPAALVLQVCVKLGRGGPCAASSYNFPTMAAEFTDGKFSPTCDYPGCAETDSPRKTRELRYARCTWLVGPYLAGVHALAQ